MEANLMFFFLSHFIEFAITHCETDVESLQVYFRLGPHESWQNTSICGADLDVVLGLTQHLVLVQS